MAARLAKFNPDDEPPHLVDGFIHQRAKVIVTGGSKSFKTFALQDLATSVATGTDWWGFGTNSGKVLYINFELDNFYFDKRMAAILEAKKLRYEDEKFKKNFWYFGFRGKAGNWGTLMVQLAELLRGQKFVMIVVDPLYKGLGMRKENVSEDMAALLNELEELCVASGAAVVFGHHHAKGAQGGKDAIDRGSGSGVLARDPDCIIDLARLEEQDDESDNENHPCFVVEPIIRNLEPVKKFGLRWDYPLMERNDTLDLGRIRKPGTGREEPEWPMDDFLATLPEEGASTVEWSGIAKLTLTMSEASFYRYRRRAVVDRRIEKKGRLWTRCDG